MSLAIFFLFLGQSFGDGITRTSYSIPIILDYLFPDSPFRTDDMLAKQVGEGRNSTKHLICFTKIIPELLDIVDEKRITLMVAVEMSFFTCKIQGWIHEYCLDVRIPKENLYEYLNSKMAVPDTPEKLFSPGGSLISSFRNTYPLRNASASSFPYWRSERKSRTTRDGDT